MRLPNFSSSIGKRANIPRTKFKGSVGKKPCVSQWPPTRHYCLVQELSIPLASTHVTCLLIRKCFPVCSLELKILDGKDLRLRSILYLPELGTKKKLMVFWRNAWVSKQMETMSRIILESYTFSGSCSPLGQSSLSPSCRTKERGMDGGADKADPFTSSSLTWEGQLSEMKWQL